MSNFTSKTTVRRRKTPTTKSKSKRAASHANAASVPATTCSITNASAISPTLPDERLQRYSLSDILVGLMRCTTIKQSNNGYCGSLSNGMSDGRRGNNYGNEYISTKAINNNAPATFILRATTPKICNGNIICCHDLNCTLNTLNGQMSSIVPQQNQHIQCLSFTSNASTSSHSSPSQSSRRSRSSTGLTYKEGIKDAAVVPFEQKTISRDRSSNSDISTANAETKKWKGIPEIVKTDLALSMPERYFTINLQLDIGTWLLLSLAFCTRFYKLSVPQHVVFDEIHYGKYISSYLRNVFFFDQHPPLGKQLIAAVAHIASNYDGNYTFPYIGAEYTENVPIFWLRFLPALCGSALAPIVYKLLLAARLSTWFALLGGLLIIFDNALLTQSRFILMESMLLFFASCGLYYMIRFQNSRFGTFVWLIFGLSAISCFTFAASIKYAGFLTYVLTAYLSCRYLWDQLYDATISNFSIVLETISRVVLFTIIPITLYVGIFYIHLQTLYRAGPHDSVMTSAFQASLEGGLASLTKGQPLKVVHGSQITLRHTHGRTCWLHSHPHVYPIRYPDKRGSSHQQQVTCYSYKDVNNWWIVKRPERENLVVGNDLDIIKHGDIIQLVHGITSRGLNSHDVAAPMTPDCQEVSCYIDYKIKMSAELLWKVDILNRNTEGQDWHAIKSEIRLIHHTTGSALRYSGRQLPEWGFNQHEVVADRIVDQKDTIWNVEEHRYTKTQNLRERERQLLKAEMIPTTRTKLNFLAKFLELQTKMFLNSKPIDDHMYSSLPHEWPLLDRGIAYWVNPKTNSQIHLLGNIIIWYSGTFGILIYLVLNIFYLLRRRRLHFDLPEEEWKRFRDIGDLFLIAYFIYYIPYFTVDQTLFLHHYFPAYLFKILLLCYVFEHIDYILRLYCYTDSNSKRIWLLRLYRLGVLVWFFTVIWVFIKFLPITYGFKKLSYNDLSNLRWKDTWDFIISREDALKNLFI